MEKTKLIETRKARGYSQNYMAERLFMDVSNYNRREKGLAKISTTEWKKLSQILETPVEDIFESEDSNIFVNNDNVTVGYQGSNTIYSIPEHVLETQRKYIQKLEEEIAELRKQVSGY